MGGVIHSLQRQLTATLKFSAVVNPFTMMMEAARQASQGAAGEHQLPQWMATQLKACSN